MTTPTSLIHVVKLLFSNNNPGVTKIKNTQYDAVYACEFKTLLNKEKHYMFVMGGLDVIPLGSNVQIEDIDNIKCIQFRTFDEPIVQHVLTTKLEFNPLCNSVGIKRYNISTDSNNKKISEYMFEYDRRTYNAHIFHTTDSDYEYVPDGNLLSALITWNTMIIPSIDIVGRELQHNNNNNIEVENTNGNVPNIPNLPKRRILKRRPINMG